MCQGPARRACGSSIVHLLKRGRKSTAYGDSPCTSRLPFLPFLPFLDFRVHFFQFDTAFGLGRPWKLFWNFYMNLPSQVFHLLASAETCRNDHGKTHETV